MTNSNELRSEMSRYGDTGTKLAEALGITISTFSQKLNNKNGAEFTQKEIALMKVRYSLTSERIDAIFFAEKVPN